MFRARGGKVHDDEAEDRAIVKKMVKKKALRAEGGAVKARADKAPRRARGGHVKHGKSGKTNVNVIVAPGKHDAPMAGVGAMPPMPPPMPPKPPMAPPAAPPAAPPMAGPPGGMPIRRTGGRAYKMGGKVHDDFGAADMKPAKYTTHGDLWGDSKMKGYKRGGKVEGKKSSADMRGKRMGEYDHPGIGARTPIQHTGNKGDTQNIGRKAVITKATGGPIYADGREGKEMGPDLHAGANSGVGRKRKNELARSEHWEK